MSSTIKKYTVIISFVLLIGILFMCLYSFPKGIHVDHQALNFFEGNPKSAETITVKIEGTLYRPIFKQHSFEGNIEIEGYDFTKPNKASMKLFVSEKENGVYWGSILYTKETSPPEIVGPVAILFNEDFNQVSLVSSLISENKEKSNENTMIVIGSNKYEEAVTLYGDLRAALGF